MVQSKRTDPWDLQTQGRLVPAHWLLSRPPQGPLRKTRGRAWRGGVAAAVGTLEAPWDLFSAEQKPDTSWAASLFASKVQVKTHGWPLGEGKRETSPGGGKAPPLGHRATAHLSRGWVKITEHQPSPRPGARSARKPRRAKRSLQDMGQVREGTQGSHRERDSQKA